jgi:glycerophosphoryl diester phosphodiesterase
MQKLIKISRIMEIQEFKKTVYLPIKVEDELPEIGKAVFTSDEDIDTCSFLANDGKFKEWYQHFEHNPTHWLKQQEGYFFTPEQLNEYTANVIKQALETAAEKAKVIEEELGSDEYREIPIDTFECTEFTADKGYEECYFYRYKCSKQSITNTFEETFQKHKV